MSAGIRVSIGVWEDVQRALQDKQKWLHDYNPDHLRGEPNEELRPLLHRLQQMDSQKSIWIAIAVIMAVTAIILGALALAGVVPFASGLIFSAFPAGLALLGTIMAVWTHCQYRGQVEEIAEKAKNGVAFW